MARIPRDIYRFKMSRDLEITIPLRPHPPPPPRFQTNPSAKLIFAIPSKILKLEWSDILMLLTSLSLIYIHAELNSHFYLDNNASNIKISDNYDFIISIEVYINK